MIKEFKEKSENFSMISDSHNSCEENRHDYENATDKEIRFEGID